MGFQYELLPYLAQKFRHSRQKCIIRVQKKIWRKIAFRLQSVTGFNNIWSLHKNLTGYWWENAARSSGLHSTCTRARFEKITFVSKKHVSFIIMGLRVERKKFDFRQFFVRIVVETLFWVSRTTIWFFLIIFYHLMFLRSEQELMRHFRQEFWRVCWSCIPRL